MPTKKSNEIFADFYSAVQTGKSRMATAFGVHKDTAQAWGRAKPSEINPSATGKGNPVDQTARAMKIIHPHDPALAREIVEHLREVCDDLDRAAGEAEADEQGNPFQAMARVAKKQLELVLTGLGNDCNPDRLRDALKQTNSLKSSIIQLEGCLEKLISNEENQNAKSANQPS